MIDEKTALACRLSHMLMGKHPGQEDKEMVRQFQLQEGLKADGLYGPKTQKALGKYLPQVPSSLYTPVIAQINSDVEALQIINSTPLGQNLSQTEKHYVAIVARHETFYGKGWKNEGIGSNNWGAVQTRNSDPNQSFKHIDHHADGSQYTAFFKKYPDNTSGANDLIRILLKPNVKAALAAGNGDDAVASQRANGYFEAPLALYHQALRRNYEEFLKKTNEPRLITFTVGNVTEKKIP